MTKNPELLKDLVRVNLLYDYYGELLTDKQKQFLTMHYFQDQSLPEIASQFMNPENNKPLSRQAVFDSIKHAIDSLEEYDQKLGWIQEDIEKQDKLKKISDQVHKLEERIKTDDIIYDTHKIVQVLQDIDNQLNQVAGETETEENV
ncbi:MAG: DNA-binding protein [bacterium]|nr:DNA-binding protein [bacterium]